MVNSNCEGRLPWFLDSADSWLVMDKLMLCLTLSVAAVAAASHPRLGWWVVGGHHPACRTRKLELKLSMKLQGNWRTHSFFLTLFLWMEVSKKGRILQYVRAMVAPIQG